MPITDVQVLVGADTSDFLTSMNTFIHRLRTFEIQCIEAEYTDTDELWQILTPVLERHFGEAPNPHTDDDVPYVAGPFRADYPYNADGDEAFRLACSNWATRIVVMPAQLDPAARIEPPALGPGKPKAQDA